jgi:hypothetical protein
MRASLAWRRGYCVVFVTIPTLGAAEQSIVANRGQSTGGLLVGPLAFDNAINEAAATGNGIVS